MGISNLELAFLEFCSNIQPLGRVVTLGRQSLNLNPSEIYNILKISRKNISLSSVRHACSSQWCEILLMNLFGAKSVTSIDVSEYEGATILHDLNHPLNDLSEQERWDTVIDFGTLEHVFNIKQGFENCRNLCKNTGMILHANPSCGHNGHGFWQLSPNAYTSFYSLPHQACNRNMVFLANPSKWNVWHRVPNVSDRRIELTNFQTGTAYALSLSFNEGKPATRAIIQQSDYIYKWGKKPIKINSLDTKSNRNSWLASFVEYGKSNKLILSIYKKLFGTLNSYFPWLKPPARLHANLKTYKYAQLISANISRQSFAKRQGIHDT